MPADPQDRPTSPLQQARRERGWSRQEVTDRVREICSTETGKECRLNPLKLRHFEDGTRHPGPTHIAALCRLFAMTPQELGLTVWPEA